MMHFKEIEGGRKWKAESGTLTLGFLEKTPEAWVFMPRGEWVKEADAGEIYEKLKALNAPRRNRTKRNRWNSVGPSVECHVCGGLYAPGKETLRGYYPRHHKDGATKCEGVFDGTHALIQPFKV